MAEQDTFTCPRSRSTPSASRTSLSLSAEDGILEVHMHTFDGPVHWSYQMHHAISELWTAVGHDTNNEVLIFTSHGSILDQPVGYQLLQGSGRFAGQRSAL